MAKITVNQTVKIIRIIFVVGVAAVLIAYNFMQPRVLILHSYALDYKWVEHVNEGLMRVLKDRHDFSLYWQYMNTKNHPEESFKEKAGMMARAMIDQIKPRVIIAVDDDAQKYVGQYYRNKDGVTVVFCGLNGHMRDYLYEEATNVAGVHERVPVAAIKDSLAYIFGDASAQRGLRIGYLGDMSLPVKRDWDVIDEFDWSPHKLELPKMVQTFGQWQEELLRMQEHVDIILISNYRQLQMVANEPKLVAPELVIDWSKKNSQAIIFGINGFIVEDGGDIAIAASPIEQGQKAAVMALRILGGENPKDIPVQSTESFMVSLRKQFLQKNLVRMPMVFEAYARGMNNYFE